MKNKFRLKKIHLALAAAFLFAGCQNDDNNKDNELENNITFNLKISTLQLTRTTSGIGDENGNPNDYLAFYQFSKDGKYEQRYLLPYDGYVTQSNNTRSYSLKINESATGEKKFVVIEATESSLPELTVEKNINDLLYTYTPSADGILAPPFVMSSTTDNEKGFVTIANVEVPNNKVDLQLKRRVARFDLNNDPEVSGLIIDKVFIKNRRVCGYFGNVEDYAGNVVTDMLEIEASQLANGGKSFYLYPTLLTADIEQDEKTTVWATTKIVKDNITGPTLRLSISEDLSIKANCLYQLDTKNIGGQSQFDITIKDWEDGTSMDWISIENGISVPDDKAQIIEGTSIKGTYIKVSSDATLPYTITRSITDNNATDKVVKCDGTLPTWLSVESTTALAGNGLYYHEIAYTITQKPTRNTQFAVTFFAENETDKDLMTIGFLDPYPGTPLPCLSWGTKLYSPIHVNQSTYLVHNKTDKAYFAGEQAYTLDTPMAGILNDKVTVPCPEGWKTLNDEEAEDYIKWVGEHLKTKETGYVYTYDWLGTPGEGTDLRILAGYSGKTKPTEKDLSVFGTWPHVAWVDIDVTTLSIKNKTFGDQWSVNKDYGIPYRCIRDKAGWE